MDASTLAGIDALAAQGRTVIAAGEEDVTALVKEAIESRRSVSFYLTPAQANAVKEWYWTPERVASRGLQEVPGEEAERIRSELGVNIGDFRFAPGHCACGHVYGAFDFFQQGVREHGAEAINAIFALENARLLQVNPSFTPVCPSCDRTMPRDGDSCIEYEGDTYGGCSFCAPPR